MSDEKAKSKVSTNEQKNEPTIERGKCEQIRITRNEPNKQKTKQKNKNERNKQPEAKKE